METTEGRGPSFENHPEIPKVSGERWDAGAKTPSGRLRRFRAQAAEAAAGPPRQFPPGLSENHPAGDEGGRMLSVPARDLFFRGAFLCAPACRRPLYWDPFKTRQFDSANGALDSYKTHRRAKRGGSH